MRGAAQFVLHSVVLALLPFMKWKLKMASFKPHILCGFKTVWLNRNTWLFFLKLLGFFFFFNFLDELLTFA